MSGGVKRVKSVDEENLLRGGSERTWRMVRKSSGIGMIVERLILTLRQCPSIIAQGCRRRLCLGSIHLQLLGPTRLGSFTTASLVIRARYGVEQSSFI